MKLKEPAENYQNQNLEAFINFMKIILTKQPILSLSLGLGNNNGIFWTYE
jgi:hypothetical protein